ncbi:MAG: hypothetical protein ACI9ES_002896, partial [Oceanospirillaceae bacterium]
MASEIDALLNLDYLSSFTSFKLLTGKSDGRIGNKNIKTLSSDDYVAEFLDPKHRQKAGFLYDQYKKANNPAGLTFA